MVEVGFEPDPIRDQTLSRLPPPQIWAESPLQAMLQPCEIWAPPLAYSLPQ